MRWPAIISVMWDATSSVSGSKVASATSATSASATLVVGAPTWPPSELVPDWSVRRRLFPGPPPLIMRCTNAAASACVIAMALASWPGYPIGKTRLNTEGEEAGIGASGTAAGAAAPLDDAPGVLVACAGPRPRDRPREEERRCRPVRCLWRLRDLSGDGTGGFSGSYRQWPAAGRRHSLQLRLSLKFWNRQMRQRQKYRFTCTCRSRRDPAGLPCAWSLPRRPSAVDPPGMVVAGTFAPLLGT